jgi:hypothetical protein
MASETTDFRITELQWLKMHLRLAALEQSGARLNCRFEFPDESGNNVTCRIYFTDDDSNSMKHVSQDERAEIYEGWVALATSVIHRGLELAALPRNFVWKPQSLECSGTERTHSPVRI